MTTTVLITGANGFIGRRLAEVLIERGARVRGLVRRSRQPELEELGVELIRGDLGDPRFDWSAALAGVGTVYHLAARTSDRPQVMMEVNARGTERLSQACAAADSPPQLIYVSSIAAAGPATARGAVRQEGDPPEPVSHYGRSKRAGEEAVEAVADRVPATVVRPGIVFGPRNTEMLPIFRAIQRLGVHAVPGRRPPPLSLMHVDDVVAILLRAAEQGRRLSPSSQAPSSRAPGSRAPHPQSPSSQNVSGYYFACAPEYPDYLELGRMIGQALGRKIRCLRLPGPLPWLAGAAGEFASRFLRLSSHLSIDKIREATAVSWACSGELAHRELGVRPAADLQQQLADTADWYRRQGWL